MSILIDADTTFIVQGITGREAVNLTRECLDYGAGAKIVGGVTPGRKGREVHGVPVFDTVAQVVEHHGSPIDGSVVTVPPAFTKDAVFEAIENQIKLIVIVTERIPRRDVAQMVELAGLRGARIIGPNCLGIVNTDPQVRLNATFCDADPRPGGVALVSQSGAVGIAALRHAERRGAGLSLFVSTGNKADVSGNDLLAYLDGDARTRVIAVYLESFGNAKTFVRIAAGVGRRTPIVVLKAGRSEAGARAGLSHTAAAATPDVAINALLLEAGVMRADDLPEMFDLLAVLESAPLPRGRRVAVVGNSGGPGVLAIDACEAAGLEVAQLSPVTTALLHSILPPAASTANPVDLLATVAADVFEQVLLAVLRDPGVDMVVTVYTPLVRGAEDFFAAAVVRARAAEPGTTLVATFPGVTDAPWQLEEGALTVPFFEFPEPAVRVLGKIARYAAWRSSADLPRAERAVPASRAKARSALGVASDLPGRSHWLAPNAVTELRSPRPARGPPRPWATP